MTSAPVTPAIDDEKQRLYQWIAEGRVQLDELLLLADRLDCPVIGPRCPIPVHESATPQHVKDTYPLIFSDEFNGVLDPNKWNTRYAWGPDVIINGEDQYYVDTLGGSGWQGYNPFSFDVDGNLLITADALASNDLPPNADQPVTLGSGVITTRDSCCFKYGYVEVCIQNPCCPSGMWSAVWLLNCMYYDFAQEKNDNENGGTGSDKFNFEIDMEHADNFGCDTQVRPAYHYVTGDRTANASLWSIDAGGFQQKDYNPPYTVQSQFNQYTDKSGAQKGLLDTSGGMSCQEPHVLGVDWCPEYIDFYSNGVCIGGIHGPMDLISDQEMHLIINLAAGGNYPFANNPGQTANVADYPASLKVLWARIYAHPDSRHTKGVIS